MFSLPETDKPTTSVMAAISMHFSQNRKMKKRKHQREVEDMENYKYFRRQCDKHQPLLWPRVVLESCLIFTPAANSNDLEGEKKALRRRRQYHESPVAK